MAEEDLELFQEDDFSQEHHSKTGSLSNNPAPSEFDLGANGFMGKQYADIKHFARMDIIQEDDENMYKDGRDFASYSK